ncbi:hypothetical protein [Flavobacterium macacae]|uniref:Uncharacterized protein n=1 Tax=Flavobacterium macacae TaxID=2488993 RepID=A0A3P3W809_9FLAO|nr:hypothetical protein [Flavobacterium macacae]RRJ90834.1 hypothetical protein EG849_10210 [Flavobacterium macacae]
MKKTNLGGMPPPSTRIEFEHNIFLSIEEVRYKIENEIRDPGLFHSIVPSLKKVKALPNNRIDLSTIDERIRLHSNMQNWMEMDFFKEAREKALKKSNENIDSDAGTSNK